MTSVTPLASEIEAEAQVGGGGLDHLARSRRLGFGALTFYGAGALVENGAAYGLNTLLLFYLTVVCGISGSEAGLALGVALVFDSVVDPLVGSLSDNGRSRHGRRHPWMLASLIPIMVAFGLLFSIPASLTGVGLFAYALTALLAVRIGLSCFIVPYVALGAELSDDYSERSTIVAARVLFTVLGGALAAFLAFGVFMKGAGAQTHRDAYPPYAWSCGAIMLAGALISTLGTLRSRHRLHAAPQSQSGGLSRFLPEVAEVFANPSFRSLFVTCLIFFVATGVAGALTLHANTYFWKLTSPQILIVTLSTSFGILVGVFTAAALARVMEKRAMTMLGLGVIGLCQFSPVMLRLTGLIRAQDAVPTLMTTALVAGLGISAALIGFQSMMADAADEHDHLFGARREGLYFAGVTLSVKASSGIGALIAGMALDLIGFPHGAPAAHAGIPPGTIRALGLVYGPGAALFTAAAIAVLLTYKLSRKDYHRIRAALDERRAGAG